MSAKDKTLAPESLLGSDAWAAMTLGMSVDVFKKKQRDLRQVGFPVKDRVTDRYIKTDVIDWIETRKQIKNDIVVPLEKPKGPNINAV